MADAQVRILVVDGELFFREAIREILSASDFSCVLCEDAETALKATAADRFAVALLDIRLAGFDAIELLRQLQVAQPDLRVIVLSSSSDQELVLEALRLGACDYLAKPLHDEELLLAVRRAASGHRVASDHRGLCNRLEDLAELMEAFAVEVDRSEPQAGSGAIWQAAVRTVARALGASKTSLLLLNEDASRLDVVAAVGREIGADAMDSVPVGRGIAGRALEDSAPLVVADIRAESHFAADLAPDRYESDSFAVAPVELRGRQLGVLCATDRKGGGPFRREDLSLLRLIAAQLALRLADDLEGETAEWLPLELHDELPDQLAEDLPDELAEDLPDELADDLAEELARAARDSVLASEVDVEMARGICDVMSNEIEPETVLREALRSIETTLAADPVSLYLLDADSGELVLESLGSRGLRLDHERLPPGRGLTGVVLQRGQLIAAAEPERDPRFDLEVDTATDQKPGPLLCVPLRLRGKTVGLCRIHLAPGASVSARSGELLIAVLSAAARSVLLYRSLLESIEEVAEARREARG